MPKPRLVAIINVTPDSFSDGGQYEKPDSALAAIAAAISEGADVIDIGAESTRPGATALTAEQEWERLEPVLAGLSRFKGMHVVFSLDTRHAANAKKALGYGIKWINDVSGFSSPDMVHVAAGSDCMLVVMHSLSVPADTSVTLPEHADPISELLHFATDRFAALEAAGIERERIIFDPGIGFGKTAAQSLDIIKRIHELQVLDVPLLVGHSRKSFLSQYAAGVSQDRDEATLAISKQLAAEGVDYLRVHDIAAHRKLLGAKHA